jgi:DNA excision repair protein ERCC-4
MDPFHIPIGFHRNIIEEISLEGGLLVLARGLGLNSIIKSLAHLYADPKVLVFLITNESDDPLMDLDDEKNSYLAIETAAYINRIRSDHSIKERSRIYGRGGFIMLSARVFLMDLLHSRIPIPLVTGVMIQDAHKVSEHGMEAFCLYLLRKQNEIAFIKAFSDNPEGLIRGFSKAEKILKTLRISQLFLFPRFHVEINSELSHSRVEIVEISSTLTQRMRMIQMSILGILESSIGDICKDNSLNTEDFNIGLSVLEEFDSIIRQHLESDWHRVGFKTKQLLKEIRTLRNILKYSVDYDAVTFYSYLKIQVEEAQGLTYNSSAYWLLSDSANVLVEIAKERALAKEINPKWKALESIVEECEISRKALNIQRKPVLIIAESSQSLVRLAILLVLGPKKYLEKLPVVEENNKRVKTDEEQAEQEVNTNLKTIFDIEGFFDNLNGRNIILRTLHSIDTESLKMLDPHSIILYAPDLEVIRTIELFKLINSEEKIKLFFFMYSDSIEEQRYLTQVRREKEAFEKLIQTKAVMAPYNEEAGISIEFLIEDVVSRGASSGAKGVLTDSEFPRKIIVDTRDLRSSLPFLLHLYGFEIEPLTIPIGDYILSPTICVERKSLPDLIQSLNSGRL